MARGNTDRENVNFRIPRSLGKLTPSVIGLIPFSSLPFSSFSSPNNNFSINNGTTLLKLWNNPLVNSLDSRDWAAGTNDAFNQFSNSGVTNPVSNVDLRLMDVIGYDRIVVPEPSTLALAAFGFAGLVAWGWRRRAHA